MPGYLTLEDWKTGKQSHWLTLEVGDGWTAVFRLTYSGDGASRRARIGEIRIVPGQGVSFAPQRNYDAFAARERAAGRPIPPVSFDAIRRSVTARRFTDALAAVVPDDDDPAEWGNPATKLDRPAAPRRGRPPRPRVFYAKFALRYDKIENHSRRDLGDSTRDKLARHYKVPLTTIAKWLYIARQHGLLTPVQRGQRGGMATALARTLTRQGEK